MCSKIKSVLAVGSLLAAVLFSSAVSTTAFAKPADHPTSRAEKCRALVTAVHFFFDLDQDTCMKYLKD